MAVAGPPQDSPVLPRASPPQRSPVCLPHSVYVFIVCVCWRGLPSLSSRICSSHTPVCNQLISSPGLHTCLSSAHQLVVYPCSHPSPRCCFNFQWYLHLGVTNLPFCIPASSAARPSSCSCLRLPADGHLATMLPQRAMPAPSINYRHSSRLPRYSHSLPSAPDPDSSLRSLR